MSMYTALVEYDWDKLEKQSLYVKRRRMENKKHGYRIELAVDRHTQNDDLIGSTFYVYGHDIPDIAENSDVVIKIDKENSTFINQKYGAIPYIVVDSLDKKDVG